VRSAPKSMKGRQKTGTLGTVLPGGWNVKDKKKKRTQKSGKTNSSSIQPRHLSAKKRGKKKGAQAVKLPKGRKEPRKNPTLHFPGGGNKKKGGNERQKKVRRGPDCSRGRGKFEVANERPNTPIAPQGGSQVRNVLKRKPVG